MSFLTWIERLQIHDIGGCSRQRDISSQYGVTSTQVAIIKAAWPAMQRPHYLRILFSMAVLPVFSCSQNQCHCIVLIIISSLSDERVGLCTVTEGEYIVQMLELKSAGSIGGGKGGLSTDHRDSTATARCSYKHRENLCTNPFLKKTTEDGLTLWWPRSWIPPSRRPGLDHFEAVIVPGLVACQGAVQLAMTPETQGHSLLSL